MDIVIVANMQSASEDGHWIFSSNPRVFDADGAFRVLREVTWSERGANVAVGDSILLYGSAPLQGLIHECIVVGTGQPLDLNGDDAPFWAEGARDERRTGTWLRLRHLREFSLQERASLSLRALQEQGLKVAPQGRVRTPAGVMELVDHVVAATAAPEDATAEYATSDDAEIARFEADIRDGRYAVSDKTATAKTRGSAQRAFANAVKRNAGYRCVVTGIRTRPFLVASHIVPWSEDELIRLDPANGLCLSTLVDRALRWIPGYYG